MSGRLLLGSAVAALLWHLSANAFAATAASTRSPVELVAATAKARKAASAEREHAAKALIQLRDLAAQRKQMAATIAERRRLLAPHVTAAKAAFKSYEAANKAGRKGPAELALLEKARAEYAAADALFAELSQRTTSLRSLEATLAQKQDEMRQAAAAAKASAADASASAAELQAQAKSNGDAAQQASTAAGSAARSVLTKASIAPKGYGAARAKADAEDQKLARSVADVGQALAGLQAAPKPAAPKQCDLRKVDWQKLYPPTSETTADGTNEFGVAEVTYPDLDGDGVAEALVTTMYSYLGASASQRFEWILFRRDRECTLDEVQTFSGMTCASVEARGKLLTFDNRCGDESAVVDYQLLDGKLKETKRRAQ